MKVVEAMAEMLRGRGRGCDVQLSAIDFTDPRYVGVPVRFFLQEHHLEEARKFADGLANRLLVSTGEPR
jgi:hypothetical protein